MVRAREFSDLVASIEESLNRSLKEKMNALYLSGFGISVNVDKARLIVKDGFLEPDSAQVTYELQPRPAYYDSIIIEGQTGTVSLTAIKWLMRHLINRPNFCAGS